MDPSNSAGLISCMDVDIYKAATKGNIAALEEHGKLLHQILTPTKSTVLHIYIANASCRPRTLEETLKSVNTVRKILEMCPQPLVLQPDGRGDIALHIAARHGSDAMVEVLIDAAKALHGGDVEKGAYWRRMLRTTNNEEDTALHEAVRFHHLGVVERLTKEDPEFLYSANAVGETPLFLAVERGHHDLVRQILSTCQFPAYQGPNGRTALHAAVIDNDEGMTRELLKYSQGDLITAVDQHGWTALHFAALSGHTSIVRQLLDCDKFPAYVGDNDKKTALHIAARVGHLDVVKELNSRCPDCFELVDGKGRNVLHHALVHQHFGIVNYVRQDSWLSNVLLNGKDVDRNTPFHQLRGAPLLMWNFLDDARVDKMPFNKNNLTPYDIIPSRNLAIQKGYLKYSLKKRGAKPGRRQIQISHENDDSNQVVEKNRSDVNEEIKEFKEAHLVVAALIATVTFAAGLNLPGGFQQSGSDDEGVAVLIGNTAFRVFLFANTTAMCTSTCSVLIHLILLSWTKESRRLRRKFTAVLYCTTFALIAMVVAFLSATYAVLGKSTHLPRQLCLVGSMFFAILLVYHRVYKSFRVPLSVFPTFCSQPIMLFLKLSRSIINGIRHQVYEICF